MKWHKYPDEQPAETGVYLRAGMSWFDEIGYSVAHYRVGSEFAQQDWKRDKVLFFALIESPLTKEGDE